MEKAFLDIIGYIRKSTHENIFAVAGVVIKELYRRKDFTSCSSHRSSSA